MYAVIRTGGKQYKVAENDVILVEKLGGEAGDIIQLDDVLMLGDEDKTTVGTPTVEGASVAATVVEQGRGDKILVFKKKRRKNYRRTMGHRQDLTVLRITDILADGKKKAAAKKAAPMKTEKPADDAPEAEAKTEADKPAAKKKAAPKKAAPKKAAASKAKDDTKKKPAAKKPAAKKKAADSESKE